MKSKITSLRKICKRPKVLLLGNGLNRSFGSESWGDILSELSCTSFEEEEKAIIDELTFPLQAIVYTGDNVDEGIKLLSEKLTNMPISEGYSEIINEYINLDFDVILTTNYTYDIERGIDKNFSCKARRSSKYRKKSFNGKASEEQFGLFKYMYVNDKYIWHIHGEAAREDSMILGHYYYGKLLACMQKYISTLIRRYKGLVTKGDFLPLSWIDYFMLGDVYIVGLGLDQSEIDLWWLLNCKKRHNKELNGGKVYWFEPNMKNMKSFSRYKLAEVNNIEVITENVKSSHYMRYYRTISKTIKDYL